MEKVSAMMRRRERMAWGMAELPIANGRLPIGWRRQFGFSGRSSGSW
jgi:hypothetical protein